MVDTPHVKVFITLALSFSALAQDASDPAARIRSTMQASLDQQRASVRKQADPGPAKAGDFFTVPWSAAAALSANTPAAAGTTVANFACDPIGEPELATIVNDASAREDIKPAIVRAVIQKESSGYPCAVSPKGAQGLMQLMPATATQLNVADAFDPKQNIDAGTKFLKQLLTRYGGDLSLALGAYNAGSGRVDKEGGVPQNAETQNYVAEILSKLAPPETSEKP